MVQFTAKSVKLLGNGFGRLIAAGVLQLNGAHGIAGWRYLFIVEGSATPEYPHNARILTPLEGDLGVWRIEREAGAGEAHEEVSTWGGFVLAMTDIKLSIGGDIPLDFSLTFQFYALVFCMVLAQGMNTVGNFFPTIVSTLGYNSNITLLLTAPPYIFACYYLFGMSWISDRRTDVYSLTMVCLALSIVAYVIALATLSTGARYLAMMLLPSVSVGPQLLLFKTLNLHLARPYPKRAAGVAMLNAIGGTSNIWGSYLYVNPPHFYMAFSTLVGLSLAFMITITGYLFHVRSINKKLDAGGEQADQCKNGGVTKEQIDMGWRYIGY